jgi:phospholipid/cholesterol/gamma-HCH transport system ATP-binding protein
MIELRGVCKKFGERIVLDDVTATLPSGKTTVLLGPSGSGKSTLLRMMVGLLAPDGGEVIVDGNNVPTLRPAARRALCRRVGMLFQDSALFGSMSVFDNVAFPLRHVKRAPEREVVARVNELLTSVGLAEFGARFPERLSGGQRKRVGLARALALDPEFVLFDEPTSGLDPQTAASIDQLLSASQQREPRTFVVITHDIDSARSIADRVGLLWQGRLRAFGPAADVFASTDPVVRAFLDRQPL